MSAPTQAAPTQAASIQAAPTQSGKGSTVPWQRIEGILAEALELGSTERRSLLDEQCRGEPTLRRAVEDYLGHAEEPNGFLGRPALVELAESGRNAAPSERVGSYRLLRPLGHGGMASVFLAQRDDNLYRSQVAVKVFRESLDGQDLLCRFRNEIRILAELDHPNIVRLLDAGTTDAGRLYFVMERVAGESVDAFCKRHRPDIRARLRLFTKILDAVDYAHQNLVVHRDLKPSNILVTAAGEPKLLDFGIAKILQPGSGPDGPEPGDATLCGGQYLTPAFASPEQFFGERISTASDVYSLGVLLYLMLTGTLPRNPTGLSLMELTECFESTPSPPSQVVARSSSRSARRLSRQLAGDVDCIVLKALRSEREQRYHSIERMAEDVRRHLEGLPVEARDSSHLYKALQLVRRHKLATAFAATVLALLVVATVVISSLVRELDEKKKIAERMTLHSSHFSPTGVTGH